MSIDIMNRIWWRDDFSMTVKIVALALADAANDDGVCWPAIATIARKCSCAERTVQNVVKDLAEREPPVLAKHERKDRSSYYRFNLRALPYIERPRRAKEAGPFEGTGASHDIGSKRTGESDDTDGCISRRQGVHLLHPETSIEPSIEPSSPLTPQGEDGDLFGDSLPVSSIADQLAEHFVESWHALAAKHDRISDIDTFSEKRVTKLMARLESREADKSVGAGKMIIDTLMKKIDNSPFLCGEVKNWAVYADWVLGPENFDKTMERRNERDNDPEFANSIAGAAVQAYPSVRDYYERRNASRGSVLGQGRGVDEGGHLRLGGQTGSGG